VPWCVWKTATSWHPEGEFEQRIALTEIPVTMGGAIAFQVENVDGVRRGGLRR